MRLAVVALSLMSLALPAAAQLATPQRKAGNWQMTMTMQGMPKPMVSQFCTDPTVEKKVSALGQAAPGQSCSDTKVSRSPGGFAFESTCAMGGRTTHTKGTATGDFNSAYKLVMVSEMSPPIAGRAQSTVTIDNKWLGPCPAGKTPGDMTMPGGMTVNIANMTGRAPPKR